MDGISPYISQILCQIHPFGMTLSDQSLNIMSVFLEGILFELLKSYQQSEDINESAKNLIPRELFENILSETNKSLNKFKTSLFNEKPNYKNTKASSFIGRRSTISGLTISVFVIELAVRELANSTYSDYFLVYITTLLEYLTGEILELSGNVTKGKNKHIIQAEDIIKAIDDDKELKTLANKIFAIDDKKWNDNLEDVVFPNLNNSKKGLLKYIEKKDKKEILSDEHINPAIRQEIIAHEIEEFDDYREFLTERLEGDYTFIMQREDLEAEEAKEAKEAKK